MTRGAESGLGRPSAQSCPECGTRFRRALLPFRMDGHLFGYFPADVCGNGHEYFTEERRAAIQAAAKARGMWGAVPARPRRASKPRLRRDIGETRTR